MRSRGLLPSLERAVAALERGLAPRAAPAPHVPITPKRLRPKCGARCRAGHACRAPAVWARAANAPRNGRCRLHGGLSTGPRTAEGKARIVAALRARLARERGAAA